MTATLKLAQPARVVFDAQNGLLAGRTGRYEKRPADLEGLYQDTEAWARLRAADPDTPVYWVEDNRVEEGPGALIVGISVLEPGRVGDEFFMTRGHLHIRADRAEVYHCLSGQGVMLLDALDGSSHAIELTPGAAVQVPGYWVHRSVNTGPDRFVTSFIYAVDAGQNYEIIARAGGMKNLVVADGDGWTTRPNPRHRGYGEQTEAPPY